MSGEGYRQCQGAAGWELGAPAWSRGQGKGTVGQEYGAATWPGWGGRLWLGSKDQGLCIGIVCLTFIIVSLKSLQPLKASAYVSCQEFHNGLGVGWGEFVECHAWFLQVFY